MTFEMNERAQKEPVIDQELSVLALIEQQLREFDHATQMRMLGFIHSRLKSAQSKSEAPR